MAAFATLSARGRPTAWLVVGTLAGIVLAAGGLVVPWGGGGGLPAGVVARVNGEPIYADDYERALAALAADRRTPLDDGARRHVLDRLIDEELLVQRGLELGLARHDAQVRANLTRAVIASVVVTAEEEQPGEGDLRRFYAENGDFFARTGRLRVRQIFFRVPRGKNEAAIRQRAEEAAAALREGEGFAELREEVGDPEIAPLPDTLLPPEKLVDYVGPTVLRKLLTLEPGATTDPIRSGTGWHVLELVERTSNELPPFEEIRANVEAEYRRRSGERALRKALDRLRERGDVEIRERAG